MKRAALLLFGLVLSALLLAPLQSHAQNTSNFSFDSLDVEYHISKDPAGHSNLRVVETFVARFPNFDQNHGIERFIPDVYDGHPVGPRVTSITDGSGKALNYTTRGERSYLVLRIGEADKYVRGQQTYRIEYTLTDVTKSFESHDEFFWDINGTGWNQPFQRITATLHVPAGLKGRLQDRAPQCFTGREGSKARNCRVTRSSTLGKETISVMATAPLGARENLSLVVGFQKGTFTEYVKPPLNPIWYLVIALAAVWYVVLPAIVAYKAWRYWQRHGRDPRGKGTIVPEYVPPKDVSIPVASVVLSDRMQTKAVSAQLINLAISGYIKLYETGKKKYELELINTKTDQLKPDELAILHLWFSEGASVGAREKLNKSKSLYTKVQQVSKLAASGAQTQGFMQDVSRYQKRLGIWGGVFLGFSFITFNVPGVLAGIFALVLNYHMPARTEPGVTLRDYLHGLKMYMQVAEEDRIKAMQAPSTAEKVDVNDKEQLVKLYERLLPYAMLFGIEKEWAKQFAALYTQPPDWYSGNYSAFNAGVFAGSLASLSSSTTTSISPPTSSSSSGFSGGGSSGGGGGGGGGGGW